MATKTVVCPECDSPLAPGRFSCSVCGALVASVATMSRSFAPGVESAAPPAVEPAAAPVVAAMPPAVTAGAALPAEMTAPLATAPLPVPSAPAPVRKARITPALPRRPKSAADVDVASGSNGTSGTVSPAPAPVPVAPEPPASWVLAEPARAGLAGEVPQASPQPAPTPSWPDRPVWPPARSIDAIAPPVEPAAARAPAGAYLPPSAVLPPAEALPLPGAVRADGSPAGWSGGGADANVSTSWRVRLGEGAGPLGLPVDVAIRIVLLGAGISLLGFLLPWADIVIGSGVMDGYVAQWGLAGPGHPLVLILLAGLFGLTLIVERLPRWARLGLPSIGLACLIIGLAWPYLAGPFDASIGVYVVAIGALVMIAGGLLDRITSRHAEPATSV
jgi:hypothetical protein